MAGRVLSADKVTRRLLKKLGWVCRGCHVPFQLRIAYQHGSLVADGLCFMLESHATLAPDESQQLTMTTPAPCTAKPDCYHSIGLRLTNEGIPHAFGTVGTPRCDKLRYCTCLWYGWHAESGSSRDIVSSCQFTSMS